MWFGCPFAALLLAYVIADPFKVIGNYESYYPEQVAGGVSLNPAHVATRNYLRQHQSGRYDSFILGNSRSIYYPIAAWRQHLLCWRMLNRTTRSYTRRTRQAKDTSQQATECLAQ